MSFSTSSSSRFDGPGSYLADAAKMKKEQQKLKKETVMAKGVLTPSGKGGSNGANVNRASYKAATKFSASKQIRAGRKTPSRSNAENVPAYMRGTASSARKQRAPGSSKKVKGGGRTLAWDKDRGEGADTFYEPVKQSRVPGGGVAMSKQMSDRHGYIKASQGEGKGETNKGHGTMIQTSHAIGSKGRNFRRGKHGRFSMAGSYLLASRGHGGDDLGRGHSDMNANAKGTILGMKSKVGRFDDKNSYITDAKGDATDVDYQVSHGDLVESGGAVSVKYVPEPAFSRTDWMKKDTILSDKDLVSGNDISGTTISDFKGRDEVMNRAKPTSAFGGAAQRFADKKLDEGQIALGQGHTDIVDEIDASNCPVNYSSKKKHGRFSEVGGLYHGMPKGLERDTFVPAKLPYGNKMDDVIEEGDEEEEEEEEEEDVDEESTPIAE